VTTEPVITTPAAAEGVHLVAGLLDESRGGLDRVRHRRGGDNSLRPEPFLGAHCQYLDVERPR